MSVKQALLLAVMGLALLASAAPGTAAAFQIKDHGNSVEDKEFESSGKVKYEALGSGVECTVHQRITANGTTATVTKSEFTASTCITFGNPYKNCKVTSVTTTGLPWSVTVEETSLTFSEDIDFTFESLPGKTCAFSASETVTQTVEHPTDVNKKTNPIARGWEKKSTTTCKDKVFGETTEAETGTLEVLGSDSETYEIA